LEPRLKAILDEAKVPMLQGTLESLKAISHLAAYAHFQRERKSGQARPEVPPLSQETKALIKGKTGLLSHEEGQALLQQMGISELCPQDLAQDESKAKTVAEKLGFPVVVKGQSSAIPHKTEAGLVKLCIADQDQLKKALEQIKKNTHSYNPKAKLEGFLIQKMAPADQSVEVIVGVNHDPLFGPVVVLGLGGIFVELLKDVQLGLAPLSRAEALKMIHSLKKSEIFEEFRGRPPVDKEALADLLVKVGEMALSLGDRLSSLDLNPVMVLPRGQGVWAVDTLIELRQPAD
jgi:acetyltransferase